MATYIATSTQYTLPGDAVREQLAMKFLLAASKLRDTTVVVVDGGSDQIFLGFARDLGIKVYPQVGPSMHDARLEALQYVDKLSLHDRHGVVVWSEPEKVGFVKSIPHLVSVITHGADMVMPRRRTLNTYPRFQAHTEMAAANFVATIVGENWDEFFGPVVLRADWLWCFLRFRLEDYGVSSKYAGWLLNHGPRLVAKKAGAKIVTSLVSYSHPYIQTKEEQNNLAMCLRRVDQMQNLLPILWIIAFKLGLTDQEPPAEVVARFAM